MRRTTMLALVAVMALVGGTRAQDAPKPPTPEKEHAWLKQLEGEWETEGEMLMEPGKPAIKSKGVESVRSLGGFWSVAEIKGECLGEKITGMMTLGYDAQKKKYVGTWVCSMDNTLWKYEGSVEGKVLTLECEGPCPKTGKQVKMKDVVEIKDKDTKVLTSSILGEDGKWVTFMTMTSKRRK